jgi:hypothetical protein
LWRSSFADGKVLFRKIAGCEAVDLLQLAFLARSVLNRLVVLNAIYGENGFGVVLGRLLHVFNRHEFRLTHDLFDGKGHRFGDSGLASR